MLFAVARGPTMAVLASVVAGAAWTLALATLNVSAQLALPDWVRGRGLAMFVAASSGAMAVGSPSGVWSLIWLDCKPLNSLLQWARSRPFL